MSAIGYHHGCTTSRNGGHAHVAILPTRELYWGLPAGKRAAAEQGSQYQFSDNYIEYASHILPS
jgi:hypothetical protein